MRSTCFEIFLGQTNSNSWWHRRLGHGPLSCPALDCMQNIQEAQSTSPWGLLACVSVRVPVENRWHVQKANDDRVFLGEGRVKKSPEMGKLLPPFHHWQNTWRNDLKEERFILALTFRGLSPWQWGGHSRTQCSSSVGGWDTEMMPVLLGFFPYPPTPFKPLAFEMMLPIFREGLLPLQLILSETPSDTLYQPPKRFLIQSRLPLIHQLSRKRLWSSRG